MPSPDRRCADADLPAHDASQAPDPRLAALRAAGAPQHNPRGFAFLEALARRAGKYRGAARQRLETRLTDALAEFTAQFDTIADGASSAPRAEAKPAPAPSPLAALLRELAAGPDGAHDLGTAAAPTAAHCEAPGEARSLPELKALDYFRAHWTQLSVEQQFAQAMAQAPDNAGPLNSHLLILRALQRMRELSPDYLHRFMAYADALIWLDQATGGSLPSNRPVVRDSDRVGDAKAEPRRKPARRRKRPGQ